MPQRQLRCKARRQRRTPKVCKALVKARKNQRHKPPGAGGVDAEALVSSYRNC